MATISIKYNEPNIDTYEGVELDYFEFTQKRLFNSGDFIKDWYDCMRFIILELSQQEEYFVYSSSVDSFLMEGAPFDSAYLVERESKWFLDYQYHKLEGIEFFVPKGTRLTFEELKLKYEIK